MAREGVGGGAIRKKPRVNRGGIEWWRRLVLPRRGKKDSMLAPRALTQRQSDRLIERTAAWLKSLFAPRATKKGHLARGAWVAERGVAEIQASRGNAITSMGDFVAGRQLLHPEEALFLADRAALDLCVARLPMSVQRAWAELLSAPESVSLPVYLTQAHLRRAGFVARRFDESLPALGAEDDELDGQTTATGRSSSRATSPLPLHTEMEPDLSVWRVTSFKRRNPILPAFYVKSFHVTDPVPELSALRDLSQRAGAQRARSRTRLVVNDRAAVLFVDFAANATPLSDRFVQRLREPGATERAIALRDGDVSGLFDDDVLADLERGGML